MFYNIRVNGVDIGNFGHHNIENIHLSVGGDPDGVYVFAGAVCTEGGEQVHYDWLQREIKAEDKIEISPTSSTVVPEPRKRFLMNQPIREPSSDIVCDFCQRNETQVKRIIYIDEHRPSICCECVELCNGILGESV